MFLLLQPLLLLLLQLLLWIGQYVDQRCQWPMLVICCMQTLAVLHAISNSWQVVVGGLGPFVTNMLHVSWLNIYLKQFITQWWLGTTWLVRISSMVQLELGVWLCVSGH